MAVRRERKNSSALTFFLLLLAVVASLLALVYYRNDLRKLFRVLFLIFLLFGAFISCRHVALQLWRRVALHLRRRQPQEEQVVRPDLDQEKEVAVKRAQERHNKKAVDFESRIGAPRREMKLKQAEEKSMFIRGFHGEGEVLGGGGHSETRLRRPVHRVTSPEILVTPPPDDHVRSLESHVTSAEERTTENAGETITLSLRQPHKTSRKQFRTTDKVEAVYTWALGLGELPSSEHVLVTTLPRSVLEERGRSLAEYGVTADAALVVEERE